MSDDGESEREMMCQSLNLKPPTAQQAGSLRGIWIHSCCTSCCLIGIFLSPPSSPEWLSQQGSVFFSLHFNVTELVDWLLSTLDCFPLVIEDDDFFSGKLLISYFS